MRRLLATALFVWIALLASSAGATVIGYWRMEVDDDPSAEGLSVANEITLGTPLISTEAMLDAANLPVGIVPLTAADNFFSVAATRQGGANGINASAAYYAALSVTSITVEYWARTVENNATPFRMSSGGMDGIVIANPNSLDVTYHVDDGGTTRRFTLANVHNMSGAWHHYAFVYDEVLGIAEFYVDNVVVASFDGPDGAPLVIAPGTAVEAGVLMDFASAGQGTLDELRIHDSAVLTTSFLLPEAPPAALWLGAAVALGWAPLRARRAAHRP
ncbi:MAG: hypothetical protein QNK05_10740 [Myxococcota bacterium]|nr:hypothetical protein [Myxococcota bacterium]